MLCDDDGGGLILLLSTVAIGAFMDDSRGGEKAPGRKVSVDLTDENLSSNSEGDEGAGPLYPSVCKGGGGST